MHEQHLLIIEGVEDKLTKWQQLRMDCDFITRAKLKSVRFDSVACALVDDFSTSTPFHYLVYLV